MLGNFQSNNYFRQFNGLFKKGVLVVFATLLPQLLILLSVWQNCKTEHALITNITNELTCAVRANQLASALFLAGLHHFQYVAFLRASDREKSLKYQAKLDAIAAVLSRYQSNKNLTLQLWNNLGTSIEVEAKKMFEIRPESMDNGAVEMRKQLKRLNTLAKMSFSRYETYQRAMSFRFAEITATLERERQSKVFITTALSVAVAINFCLAFFLVHSLNKNIISRLRTLLINASRLPNREQLEPRLSGNDEINQLDEVFHRVSKELSQAHEFKKNLLAMVAHDMCSPLASISLSLSIVEMAESSKLEEKSREALSGALEEIETLVVHANEILSIEKKAATSSAEIDGKSGGNYGSSSEHLGQLSKLFKVQVSDPTAVSLDMSSRYRPQLKRQMLMLFLVPLLVSATAQILLIYTNFRTLNILGEALEQSKLALDVNKMFAASAASMSYLANFTLYGEKKDASLLEFFYAQELAVFAKLKQAAIGTKEEESIRLLEKLALTIDAKKKLIEKTTPGKLSSGQTAGIEMYQRALKLNRVALAQEAMVLEIAESQVEPIDALQRQYAEVIAGADRLLAAGFTGGLVSALLAVAIFAITMRKRLANLVINASRLSTREPMLPQTSGSDEIWFLDSAVRRSAVLLQRAFEERIALLNTMSEDLRLPLGQVSNRLEQLKQETAQFSPLSQKHYDSVVHNIKRVIDMIEALLTTENLDAQSIELTYSDFAIAEPVASAFNSISALASSKGVKLESDGCDMIIRADSQRLVQVLVNFLTNAINHSPKDSAVRVVASSQHDSVKIAVEDCGPGLPVEMRTKVFERFFQTPDSATKKTGYGLGLAICKIIAEKHGGSVGVDASNSGGCSFFITIPLREF